MSTPVTVDRARVLAYRIARHGLARDASSASELDVLALGCQDTPYGAAPQALAARLPDAGPEIARDGALARVWTFRGAPHVHRRADLAALADALWPRDEKDASARLTSARRGLRAGGVACLTAFEDAARALREVVDAPRPKGEVSHAVTERLDPAYSYDCRSCRARHVYGEILQQVGGFGGVEIVGERPTVLAPLPDRPDQPTRAVGTEGLVRAYLRLHGPATLTEAAGYLGTSQAAARPSWPEDLVEVELDGRRTWLPAEEVGRLTDPGLDVEDVVRLLPPLDPFLQGRDRDLLVPEVARQKEIWRVLGNPGAVLADGELVGVWRARALGRARLEITVTAFEQPRPGVRRAIEGEAHRVATVRGYAEVTVVM